MLRRQSGQRKGRAFWWVVGVLTAGLAGLLAYRIINDLDRQSQDEARLRQLKDAPLDPVRDAAADPNDWPQWRGVNRDALAPAEGLRTDWPRGGPPLLWKTDGGGGFAGIVVSGKRVVTVVQDGDDEAVVCWEDQGGSAKEMWRHAYASKFTQDGEGPRATPTIDAGRVYSVGAKGHLFCLDLKDGKVHWRKHLQDDYGGVPPRWGFSSSPLVEKDLLLINPGGSSQTVVALDKKTGDLKWQAALGPHPGYSSPIITEACGVRQVLFFLGDALVSLDPKTGKQFWSYPWKTQHQVNAATPLVRGDYVFISSGYGKGSGLLQVVKEGDEMKAEKVYENNIMRNHYASCIFVGDHLYGFDEGFLVCMPFRAGGKRLWKEKKFNRGSLLAAGDQLVILGEGGLLALAEANPQRYEEKASFQVFDGLCWTMPTLAHGKLYVRDEKEIRCYDLRK